jgi:uncharacterized SAM-binding protein YcdF (DUF218 family)
MILIYGMLRAAGAILIIADPLQPAEALVVLSGGEERLPEAVRLMGERYGHYLILTETGEIRPGVPASQALRSEAIRLGVYSSAIMVTDRTVTSTYDEAVAVLHLLESVNLTSCTVVTDPFHTLRTRLIFRKVFRGSGITVRVHPIPASWYRSRDWFLSKEGWITTAQEYLKLVVFLLGIRVD